VDKKRTIRKVLVLSAWAVVLIGMTILLVAADNREQRHKCSDVLIGIRSTGEKFYIEESDILKQIETASGGPLRNRSVSSINLGRLEAALESSPWIRSAELYIDNRDALHVTVSEREPVARVFTQSGSSFYIDSAGVRMPLLDKLTARVPVVTGFTNARRLTGRDSILLKEVKSIAQYIYAHPFWNAQVGQIDITPGGKIELVPVIGNHIIRLGDAQKIGEKLDNLLVFYRQVMSRAGFDKYKVLDLQFEGQVVAVHKGATSPVDSIQLQQSIRDLLNENIEAAANEPLPSTPVKPDQSPTQEPQAPVKTNPNPVRTTTTNPARTTNQSKPAEKQKEQKTKPKAVMPRRG
jgi:cell division protein FtsQ